MDNFIHEHIFEILEGITAALGGAIFASKFFPWLKRFLMVFQIALFLTKFMSKYFRDHPEKKEQMRRFILQVFDHYLKTNPKGQDISRKTDLNEEVHKLLGIEVDTR